MANILTEARKYAVASTICHQERLGQFKEHDLIKGATSATASKVCFQLSPDDAEELAPEFAKSVEEVKRGEEAELIISPHPVEDIWEKGHSSSAVMDVRDEFFWIVDLLKQQPEKEKWGEGRFYIVNHERFQGLNFKEYEWNTLYYRATPEMVRAGIEAINRFLLSAMQGGDGREKDILTAIENLQALYGCFPTMRPEFKVYEESTPYQRKGSDRFGQRGYSYYKKISLSEESGEYYERFIKAIFNENIGKVIERYTKDRYDERDDKDPKRAEWQIKKTIAFINGVFKILPQLLKEQPIKRASGQYSEQIRVERTQQDLVNEMRQNLIDLHPAEA